jgi:hypothetical protein
VPESIENVLRQSAYKVKSEKVYLMNGKEGLRSNIKDPKLRECLNIIWDSAEKELHPFQKGVTAQDSNHCLRVEGNIWSLVILI